MPARTAWFGTFRSRSRRREHFLRRQPHWCPPRRDRPRAHDQRAQRICHRNARRHRSTIPQPTAARPAEGTREPNVATTPLPKSLTPSGHALTSTLMDAPPMRLNFAASLDRRPGRGGGHRKLSSHGRAFLRSAHRALGTARIFVEKPCWLGTTRSRPLPAQLLARPFNTVCARRFCDQQEISLQTATGRSLP